MQSYLSKDEVAGLLGSLIDAKIEANNVFVKEQMLPGFFKIGNLIGSDPENQFTSV
jgi:hypothetical protein